MKKIVKNKTEAPISINRKKEKLTAGQNNEKLSESRPKKSIGISRFIKENTEQIVSEWEEFAKSLLPASNNMSPMVLRDHIHEILSFIVKDIKSPQTQREQKQKSKGDQKKTEEPTAAETHAAVRLAGGFDIDQMVSEWRALRASVIKLWVKANEDVQMSEEDLIELTRFNESIDQELAESVSHYTKNISYSKDLFVSTLSHDLTMPLNVILMSAQLQLSTVSHKERAYTLASQIQESASRAIKLVESLLDVSHARFGSKFPVVRAPMDMAYVCRQIADEMRTFNPTRSIILDVSGDLKGEWDKARIGQMFSNLIGNAIQYSFKDTPVDVILKGTRQEVILTVKNEGVPIQIEKQENLFESFRRGEEEELSSKFHLGLGLYITKEIVLAHGGEIELKSTEDGNVFTVKIPKSLKDSYEVKEESSL